MIEPTASSTGASSLLNSTRTPSSTLGKDDFLTLLVTQLRNQDPMSPLQAHEFAAQLAQFSSVEQLTQLNDAVATQTESLGMVTMMDKTSFGASLIGRQISGLGNQVVVPDSGTASVRVEVGGLGGKGTLRIYDSAGKEIATKEVGFCAPGRQDLAVPSGLAPGTYRYKLEVVDGEGKAVTVTPYTTGVVDAVHFDERGIVLRIGAIEIPLDHLSEIQPAH